MTSILKKINPKNIKHKDDILLAVVALILFALVLSIIIWNISFLAASLNKATDENLDVGAQQVQFNLDAAERLGLE